MSCNNKARCSLLDCYCNEEEEGSRQGEKKGQQKGRITSDATDGHR